MDFQRRPGVASRYRRKDLRRVGNGTLAWPQVRRTERREQRGVNNTKRTANACGHMHAMSRPVGEEKAADRADSPREYYILWSNLGRLDQHLNNFGRKRPQTPKKGLARSMLVT
jgi:hypothetical protein